jgi:DUF4097 and DUF4098 domain-containing protein YvlB
MQNSDRKWYRAASFILITAVYVALVLGISGAAVPGNSIQAAPADRVIEKSFDVQPGGTLTLDTQGGKVSIEGWSRDEVRVMVELKGTSRAMEDLDITFESSRNDVTVKSEFRRRRSLFGDWNRRLNISFQVMVPYEYNVKCKTSGGGITLGKIEGTVEGRTSGGSINADELKGGIFLSTSGGPIRVGRLHGDVVVRTSGGGITVDGLYGTLEARTSGGPIRMNDIEARVDARTSGGGITLSATGENRGIDLRTSGGGINVTMDESINGRISARTSGGRVTTDFPVMVQGGMSSNTLEGTINNGGPDIVLRTSGGGIRINKR